MLFGVKESGNHLEVCDDRADADHSLSHTVNIPIKEWRSSEGLLRQSGSVWDEDPQNKSNAPNPPCKYSGKKTPTAEPLS